MATNDVKGIDIIIKKKPSGNITVQILEDGSVKVQSGAMALGEMKFMMQIGDLVSAAVNGRLQSASSTIGVGGVPSLSVAKLPDYSSKAVASKGISGS